MLDGFNWSVRDAAPAGMRIVVVAPDGTTRPIECGEPRVTESGKDVLIVTMPLSTGGEVRISCEPAGVRIEMAGEGAPKEWAFELAWDASKTTSIVGIDEHAVRYRHNGFEYSLRCGDAAASKGVDGRSVRIKPKGQALALTF